MFDDVVKGSRLEFSTKKKLCAQKLIDGFLPAEMDTCVILKCIF